MPGAGGGRNGTQGADLAALLARIDALERRQGNGPSSARGGSVGDASGGSRDRSATDAGGRRGPRGGAPGGGADVPAGGGARVRGRPGDWRCASCQAYPCFARTRVCFQCGAQRTGQGDGAAAVARSGRDGGLSRATGRGAYLGPIGAGGARPLLGGRGNASAGTSASSLAAAAPKPPSFRVPGASLAAKAEADAGGKSPAQVRGGAAAIGSDADGFQVVRSGPPPGAAEGTATVGGPVASRNAWADLAEEDDDDDDAMQQDDDVDADGGPPEVGSGDGDGGGGATGGEGDFDGGQGEGTARDSRDEQGLKRAWLDHCRAFKVLERDASMPAELVANARTLRDEAERRWRAARSPHPLSKRVRWAESDLRMAEEKESAHRRELEAHLEATSRRTRELEARIEVDMARTARKRAALQSVLAECVPEGTAEREGASSVIAARAVSGIEQDIAPPLVAAIEKLSMPMDLEAAEGVRQELQLAVASLGTLGGLLRGVVRPTVPPGSALHFDIGGGDDDDGARAGGGGACEGASGAAGVSAGGASAATTTRWTKPAAGEPWRRASAAGTSAMAPASSATAAEAARGLLRGHVAGANAASGLPHLASAADTNDLAEAAKREHAAAQAQFQLAQAQQQRQRDAQQLQQEEAERQQRHARQEEEKRAHLQALERAAADRMAEEARQRERLVASMSPEDLARAAEAHAQQLALGTQVFGSAAASSLAGLIHQGHAQGLAQGDAATSTAPGQWDEGEVRHIMDMSPEELARAAGEHHGL